MQTKKQQNIEIDKQSKLSNKSKTKLQQIDRILYQMQQTYRSNIDAQQCYLDIFKRKNQNINSNYIKNIYSIFTTNKANQICFEKQIQNILNDQIQIDQKLLRRYYARMIEMGIKKISYFWMNKNSLDFLSNYLLKFVRDIYTVYNQIYKIKTVGQHYEVLKLLFQQNAIIQQKIYELLIDDGYLLSMDEFYRINGVDLVTDRQYQCKHDKMQPISIEQSQTFIDSKKKSTQSIKISRNKIAEKQQKKKWGYTKPNLQASKLGQSAKQQKNKIKIKNMMQSMVSAMKKTIEQQKQNKNNKLQIIQEQNCLNIKSQRDNIMQNKSQIKENYYDKSKKRISKPQNFLSIEFKKKINQKKISIELMSFFSNQFKSMVSQAKDVQFDALSELFMKSQDNNNPVPSSFLKIMSKQSFYIHSVKFMQSLKRIKQQKRRGRLIKMVQKQKNMQNFAQMQNQFMEGFNLQPRNLKLKQSFSFKSAPGMYISVPKRNQFRLKTSQNSSKYYKQNKRLMVRHNYGIDNIFQNQLIVNQLNTRQQRRFTATKINCTEVNGNNLSIGIMGQNCKNFHNKLNCIQKQGLNYKNTQNSQNNKQPIDKIGINAMLINNCNRLTINDKNMYNYENNEQNKINNKRLGKIILQNKQLRYNDQNKLNNHIFPYNYKVYDRIRRKIIYIK